MTTLLSIVLALIAAIGYGISDFLGGLASRSTPALRVVVIAYPVSALAALMVAPFVAGQWHVASFFWGATAGVTGAVAILWLYRALGSGPMSIASPTTAVLASGIPILVELISDERPSLLNYVGIGLAALAVILVARSNNGIGPSRQPLTRTLALSAGSGIAFGASFVSLHHITTTTGMWPLVLCRALSAAVVCGIALARRQFALPPRPLLPLACLAGITDLAGTTALMYAYHGGGGLSLVSVIGSLYPAVTVLLALLVLRERLAPTQALGIALSLAAVGMISLPR